MEIPKTVRVAGLDYTVRLNENIYIESGLSGSHNPETLVIEIQNHAVHPKRMEQVFLHELMHAIDVHYLNSKLSEDMVDAISVGLYQVLSDNNFFQGKKGK